MIVLPDRASPELFAFFDLLWQTAQEQKGVGILQDVASCEPAAAPIPNDASTVAAAPGQPRRRRGRKVAIAAQRSRT